MQSRRRHTHAVRRLMARDTRAPIGSERLEKRMPLRMDHPVRKHHSDPAGGVIVIVFAGKNRIQSRRPPVRPRASIDRLLRMQTRHLADEREEHYDNRLDFQNAGRLKTTIAARVYASVRDFSRRTEYRTSHRDRTVAEKMVQQPRVFVVTGDRLVRINRFNGVRVRAFSTRRDADAPRRRPVQASCNRTTPRGASHVIIGNNVRGPVAQLGARFHGMEEVKGSNPFRSTKTTPNKT